MGAEGEVALLPCGVDGAAHLHSLTAYLRSAMTTPSAAELRGSLGDCAANTA